MIWVIGCNGMLGTELCRQLNEKEIDFVGTDREVDFTDAQATEKFVEYKNIDFVVNCAAYTAVDKAESEEELAQKLNVEGPRNIARLCKKIGAKLIHISTDYVFDGLKSESPILEDEPVSPVGVYSKSKAYGERKIMQEMREFYLIRSAWLYGWAGKNFVYTMIRAMNTHESVKVVNDQHGTPTFCGDLVKVILEIISRNNTEKQVPYGIYHVTDLGEITWWDFTNEIKKQGIEFGYITNKECVVNPCTSEDYPTPAKRPAYSVLCKDKIQKTLGIELPQWQESLRVFLQSKNFDEERIK